MALKGESPVAASPRVNQDLPEALRVGQCGDGRRDAVEAHPAVTIDARNEVLSACVPRLDDRARGQLERALERMVGASTHALPAAMRTSRLCDRSACRAGGHDCPLDHTKRQEVPDD